MLSRRQVFDEALFELTSRLAQLDEENDRTIFIDPERFPTPFSRRRVKLQVASEWGHKVLHVRALRERDQRLQSFARSGSAARRFREFGYISSFELFESGATEFASGLGLAASDTPIVFFDAVRFRNRRAREPILKMVAKAHASDLFNFREIAPADLEQWSVARATSADENFRRRGFLSVFECRGLGKGDNNPEPTHLARNRAAACLQLTTVATAFAAYDASERTFRAPASRGAAAEARAFKRMARFLGAQIGDAKKSALVCRDGVFLPKTLTAAIGNAAAYPIYMAQTSILVPAMEDGYSDPFRIFPALSEEKALQARFEYEHSATLFKASRAALLLWQTQALAYLRIASWTIAFLGSKAYYDAIAEAKAHVKQRRYVATLQALLRGDERQAGLDSLRLPIVRAFEMEANKALEAWEEEGANILGASCKYGLSVEQTFVSALHGGTYGPLTAERLPTEEDIKWAQQEDPMRILAPIGVWLGSLKRRRYAVLDREIAKLFQRLARDDEDVDLRSFLPLVESRLDDAVWKVLVKACEKLLDDVDASPVEINYEWACDVKCVWSAEQTGDGKIHITGPLLDFPIHEAPVWNALAETLWRPETEDFEFGI